MMFIAQSIKVGVTYKLIVQMHKPTTYNSHILYRQASVNYNRYRLLKYQTRS